MVYFKSDKICYFLRKKMFGTGDLWVFLCLFVFASAQKHYMEANCTSIKQNNIQFSGKIIHQTKFDSANLLSVNIPSSLTLNSLYHTVHDLLEYGFSTSALLPFRICSSFHVRSALFILGCLRGPWAFTLVTFD